MGTELPYGEIITISVLHRSTLGTKHLEPLEESERE